MKFNNNMDSLKYEKNGELFSVKEAFIKKEKRSIYGLGIFMLLFVILIKTIQFAVHYSNDINVIENTDLPSFKYETAVMIIFNVFMILSLILILNPLPNKMKNCPEKSSAISILIMMITYIIIAIMFFVIFVLSMRKMILSDDALIFLYKYESTKSSNVFEYLVLYDAILSFVGFTGLLIILKHNYDFYNVIGKACNNLNSEEEFEEINGVYNNYYCKRSDDNNFDKICVDMS